MKFWKNVSYFLQKFWQEIMMILLAVAMLNVFLSAVVRIDGHCNEVWVIERWPVSAHLFCPINQDQK